jgi:hypothetical protein
MTWRGRWLDLSRKRFNVIVAPPGFQQDRPDRA